MEMDVSAQLLFFKYGEKIQQTNQKHWHEYKHKTKKNAFVTHDKSKNIKNIMNRT